MTRIPPKVIKILEGLLPYDADEYIQWILDNRHSEEDALTVIEEVVDEPEFISFIKGMSGMISAGDAAYVKNYISMLIYKYSKVNLYRRIKTALT